ncbi:uncharacterized protein BX663DRAFT_150713 [Cokeromyces recurvatus]|uniref:uncharacterized protein n=1 Tax=Cokeromyces recurvatus TaxID=90255 RepID=UPI002220B089|nr:uncharacterized protein BX663DRAFT_150713 [Cokeromyces recurvatus]KAI7900595.1 hypothetical protein BX663DRAFT_150713 [Cokeromyces recurvatus]
MEIESRITNSKTMITAECKPIHVIKQCKAFCLSDHFHLSTITSRLNNNTNDGFKVKPTNSSLLLHILDNQYGGEIYIFDNGTLTCWGIEQDRQEIFLNNYIRSLTPNNQVEESIEVAEYTIDEDEITDMKNGTILLNPDLPQIQLSKIAFSYGLGRAAKLTSIEANLDAYLSKMNEKILTDNNEKRIDDKNYTALSIIKDYLFVRHRVIQNSQDGFLGTTSKFHWEKKELEECVRKVSYRFDIDARITILNKKLDYAKEITSIYKEFFIV